MDTRDGRIYQDIHSVPDEAMPYIIPMEIDPTPHQLGRMRVGRNHPCPCGSGKKFKKCHLSPEIRAEE